MSFFKSISQYSSVSSIGPTDTLLGNITLQGQPTTTSKVSIETLTEYLSSILQISSLSELTDTTKLSLSGGILTGDVIGTGATFSVSVSAPALSGTFYGDGTNLTGIVKDVSGYAPLSGATFTGDIIGTGATFTTSVSALALSGTFYGDGSNLTGIVKDVSGYAPLSGATFTGEISGGVATFSVSVSAPALSGTFYGDGSNLTGISAETKFANDLTVSLPAGKTFGRYNSGDVIPATGKTSAEVIQMAIVAPLPPAVHLTSPTYINFNQTDITNVLNFSHAISSFGATISTASLEWRRDNSGSWTQLSNLVNSSYIHTLTDTQFNTAPFNYKYTVTDSVGAATTAFLDITPISYAAPLMSLSIIAATSTSPETNTAREKGNSNSNMSGSVIKSSINTTLATYVLQYKLDDGSWNDNGSPTSITDDSATFILMANDPPLAKASNVLTYRICTTDDYTTSYSEEYAINFYNLIFHGGTTVVPANSAEVRSLQNRSFVNSLSNPFILNTGTSNTKFTVAMPSSLAITLVQDLDASNATLTNNYINSPINIEDGGGNAVYYNVYTLSIATPYSSSHRHQITRA